jgi:hypothetical protein
VGTCARRGRREPARKEDELIAAAVDDACAQQLARFRDCLESRDEDTMAGLLRSL